MPKPRSGHVRYQTGQDRNTARVRAGQLERQGKREVKPLTVRVVNYRPPLEQPVDLGTERIWDSSRARLPP